MLCNKHESELKRRHDVHHIDYNKLQGCEGHQWKLVPLCRSCHTKTNHNRKYWEMICMDKLKERGLLLVCQDSAIK